MFAMVLDAPGQPLRPAQLPDPVPGPGQVLVRVRACAVCRTDLHVVDGELPHPKLPLIPGHEIVGEVLACGPGPPRSRIGQRVGIPWLGHTCGACPYCRAGRENLCDAPGFTGYTLDGGYAEFAVADAAYCFPLPDRYDDAAGRPAAVRRPDRLPHLAHGRRRPPPRHLGLRRRRPHRGPGRPHEGRELYRLHPPRRHGGPGLRPRDGRDLGRRRGRDPARPSSTPP